VPLETQYDEADDQHCSRAAKKPNLFPHSVGFDFPVHAAISRSKAISVKRVIPRVFRRVASMTT